MHNYIRLVYLMRILLHLSTYFPNTPRIYTTFIVEKVNTVTVQHWPNST